MIPAAPNGALRISGLELRDHWFDVPLNHAEPGGETITVYAREVVAVDVPAANKPWLLYLQGGPGGKAPRPADSAAWIHRAAKDFRVLLLDQRGTGRSTPVTPRTILRLGSARAQAEYLSHLRADAIVADAELIRRRLLGEDSTWSVLGQSLRGVLHSALPLGRPGQPRCCAHHRWVGAARRDGRGGLPGHLCARSRQEHVLPARVPGRPGPARADCGLPA